MADVMELVPGLGVLVLVAVAAHLVVAVVPVGNPLVLAVVLGALLANVVTLPAAIRPGIDRHDRVLETGIVLLGASVSLDRLVGYGDVVVALVLGTVLVGIGLVEAAGRWVVPISRQEGSLLAAGASICGVSAVVAVARGIDADRETLAYVAGAVVLVDAVTLVVFPAIGHGMGLPDRVYGVWAGLAMFSTGPVAAAGFAVSPEAGRWATITKLVRNALIGVVAVGYALAYASPDELAEPSLRSHVRAIWDAVPTFLIGFVAVMIVANSGVMSPTQLDLVDAATGWLFALAFAGIGLTIRVDDMRAVGRGPIVVLLGYLLVMGGLTLLAVLAVA